MDLRDLVLVDGVRTPMAAFNGSFADISAIDLAAHAARSLFERSGIAPSEIDHVVVGNVQQTSPDALYGARHVGLKAGVPEEVPALTVNRLCGSGLQAVLSGSQMIRTGDASACLVGGMENMTQAPHSIYGARKGFRFGNGELLDSLMAGLMDTYCGCYMAGTSNNLSNDYGISREEQDEFALMSQQRAHEAIEAGRLAEYDQVMFEAIWVNQKDMNDVAVIGEVLTQGGFDAAELVAAVQDANIKGQLIEATEEAVSRGLFGVPTMFVDDVMHFGQDRLEWVARDLAA